MEATMKVIDFEAHFYNRHYLDFMYAREKFPRLQQKTATTVRKLWYFEDVGQPFTDTLLDHLMELDEGRLEQMDKYGIDVQILSLSAPGIEQLEPEAGTKLARQANDELAGVIQRHPDRYMGYAALAPKEPQKAADELERAVSLLGFKGWNTHSNFGDSYIDDRILAYSGTRKKIACPHLSSSDDSVHPPVAHLWLCPQWRSVRFWHRNGDGLNASHL
jgi:predicted TIM-barrel fold metal-dependent hydrolase